jgi:hypothetical protein
MKINRFLLLIILCSFAACRNNGERNLAEVEKQELAKNIRHDSLFMGIHFGMTRAAFFEYCWQKNKEKLFLQGRDKSVEYQLPKENSNYPIQLNFYPRFDKNDKINELPILFAYKTLDPWNPNMQTEKLLKEVRVLMQKWYGEGFFLTTLPDGKKAYAKVDGNKRTTIFVERDFEVMVVMTDLTSNN